MKVKPILWHQAADDGTQPIKIYVYTNGKKDYIHTNFHVNHAQWDKKYFKVKSSHPNADFYNANIQSMVNKIERNLLSGMDMANLKSSATDPEAGTLIGFVRKFIAECEKGVNKRASGTIAIYNTNLNDLIEYGLENVPLNFDNINKEAYNSYVTFFRGKGLNENTIGGKIKFLKMILNEAVERGVTQVNEHHKKYFKKMSNESDSIFLTEEEIEKWINADLTHYKHLQDERNAFLIRYYFLLRFGDSFRFNETNFSKIKEKYYFKMRAEKTDTETIVPVKPFIYDLLVKYNFKLPKTTNQEANDKLKKIGARAKIEELMTINGVTKPKHDFISTHTSRRSGATNLYLQGVPEKTIMDLGGWKSIATFRLYIRTSKLDSAQSASNLSHFG